MRDENLHPDGFGPGSYIVEFIITGEGLDVPFGRRPLMTSGPRSVKKSMEGDSGGRVTFP
jgi:hypothetical protein